jgi:hypothetical protein
MKITETITRECCDVRLDLICLPSPIGRPYYFCKHCGRHFEDQGGSEPEAKGIVALPWPWEAPTPIVGPPRN